MSETPELPPMALFDRRRTRRAVFRGLGQTALLVLGGFLVLSLLASILGGLLLGALGREEQMHRLQAGFVVGHPSYHPTGGFTGRSVVEQAMGTDAGAEVRLKLGFLGRLSRPLDDRDPLDVLRERQPVPRFAGGQLLRDLPRSTRVDVLLQLTRPLRSDPAQDLVRDLGGQDALMYYEEPWSLLDAALGSRRWDPRPVTWRSGGLGTGYRTFGAWTRALSAKDDEALVDLGLPDSAALRAMGEADTVVALYVEGLPSDSLRRLMRGPDVRGFVPLDVRFDVVGGTGS